MGNFVCKKCGRDNFYHAQRGSSLEDQVSNCCHAGPARGRTIKDVMRNRPGDEWVTETRRIYVINGWLQIAKESSGVRFDRVEDGVAWFSVVAHGYISAPAEWVAQYKISHGTLLTLGWNENDQRQHDKEFAFV